MSELVFSDEFEVDRGTFWPGELLSGFISFSSFLDVFLFYFSFLFIAIQHDHSPYILLRRQRLLCFHVPTHTH